jgi:hypothetical protein
MSEDRVFSVPEADALLPGLSESLVAVRRARQTVLSGGERIRRGAPTNGGGAQGKEYWEALSVLRREVEAISAKGIILRDADSGLVDFPTLRDGREVFLCWRLGEERVGYWHGPETGFSGRKPL